MRLPDNEEIAMIRGVKRSLSKNKSQISIKEESEINHTSAATNKMAGKK